MRDIQQLRAAGFVVRETSPEEAIECTLVEFPDEFIYMRPLEERYSHQVGPWLPLKRTNRLIIAGVYKDQLPYSIYFGEALTELQAWQEEDQKLSTEVEDLQQQVKLLENRRDFLTKEFIRLLEKF